MNELEIVKSAKPTWLYRRNDGLWLALDFHDMPSAVVGRWVDDVRDAYCFQNKEGWDMDHRWKSLAGDSNPVEFSLKVTMQRVGG